MTVCQLRSDSSSAFEHDWEALCDHLRAEHSECVLLPEMPFHPWLASAKTPDQVAWQKDVDVHVAWMDRIAELGTDIVIATRPIVEAGRNFNEGFVWIRRDGRVHGVHRKCYLPDEEGFWEAQWYRPGDGTFDVFDPSEVGGSSRAPRVGFAICTELWFFDRARAYGEKGAQIIASPRATMSSSVDKWLAGGRASAVVSGAYSLSSNWAGAADSGRWGGAGWIVEPEEGDVLGTTSDECPFLTREIDLGRADHAKTTYPRYVAAGE